MNTEIKDLLNEFKKILTYGYSKLSTFPFREDKYRLKKNLLYPMMAATQSYSEAIFKLMNNTDGTSVYDKAAEVLYRSLVENLINLNFIYSEVSQRRAVLFMAYSIQDKNDFAKKFKSLMLKYPKWNLVFGDIKKTEDWDSFIKKNAKMVIDAEKRFNTKIPNKLPDLASRAIANDRYLKRRGKLNKSTSLEAYYVTYYKFFSQVAHLTMPGLERFFAVDNKGNRTLEIDGKPDSIVRLISITYQIYFVFLKFTLQKFEIYVKNEFKIFNKFLRPMAG